MSHAAINGVRPGILTCCLFQCGLTTVANNEELLEGIAYFRWDGLYEYAMAWKRERLLFCFGDVAKRRTPTLSPMRA